MRKIKSKISSRVETGALQINNDWAGVFVRGDDCFALLVALEKVIPQMPFGSGLGNLYQVREGLKEICGNLTPAAPDASPQGSGKSEGLSGSRR